MFVALKWYTLGRPVSKCTTKYLFYALVFCTLGHFVSIEKIVGHNEMV
jgi:hypothetical protein